MAEERCSLCFSKIDLPSGEIGWTDDPIKTPKGEAGEDYIGFTYFKSIHIEEIQQIRQQQEIDFGIPDEEKTTFTPVKVEGKKVYFYKKHLKELRESTEKILEITKQTKEDYFNYDENGTEYNIGNHQFDWRDADINKKFLDIKAIHIEDLRHSICKYPTNLKNYVFVKTQGFARNWSDYCVCQLIKEYEYPCVPVSSGKAFGTVSGDCFWWGEERESA